MKPILGLTLALLATLAFGQTPTSTEAPAGWRRVAFCSSADAQTHGFVTEGSIYIYSAEEVPNEAVDESDPNRTVFFGGAVTCSFDGLVPGAHYQVLIRTLSDSPDRVESVWAGEQPLQERIELPNDRTVSYRFEIPAGSYANGRLDISIRRIDGPNAVAGSLALYSDDPTPLKPIPPIDYADPQPVLTPVPAGLAPIDLDGIWKFNPASEIAGPFESLEVSHWKELTVPSHWATQGFSVAKHGQAACQRTVAIPLEWQKRPIKLRFDAVYGDAVVYVNGQRAGAHQGTFTPFEVDITKYARPGQDNSIVVTVQSDTHADMLASGSQYAVFPLYGIIRSVRLFAVPQVHIGSLHIVTDLDDQYRDAELRLCLTLTNSTGERVEGLAARWRLVRWPKGPNQALATSGPPCRRWRQARVCVTPYLFLWLSQRNGTASIPTSIR